MTIGFNIDNIMSEVGTGEFLHSFFSTISFHLEPDGWGSRFPELMNELYQGQLEPSQAEKALRDSRLIKAELAKLPPERVVWRIENIGDKPPWGDEVPPSVTSLANYHLTSTNRVLMDLLIECLEFQVECRRPLVVQTLRQFFRAP